MKKLIGITLLVIIVSTVAGSNFFKKVPTPTQIPVKAISAIKEANVLTIANFEDSLSSLYDLVGLSEYGMNYDVFRYGMIGYHSLMKKGKVSDKKLVSFIDFSKKSTEKRFYTIDLENFKVKFHSLVSHGRNTGEDAAKSFSNIPHSNQSSLGFYVTGETYFGSKGYSMRLDGMDGMFNSNMRARAVVMHDAKYVSEEWIRKYGRLGRSQGCPALPEGVAKDVIDVIKDGTVIFAYFNDQNYLAASEHLDLQSLFGMRDEPVSASL